MRYAPLVVIIILLMVVGTAIFLHERTRVTSQEIPEYRYQVINTYPHDRYAFTEGLAYKDGSLVEGTGLVGNSTLRIVNLTSGSVIKIHYLPAPCFGEGVTTFGDRIVQPTDNSGFGILHIHNFSTFKQLRTFNYSQEGWGITFDGSYLIMSDGTSSLFFLDPETFRQVKKISVTANGKPVKNLNELEYVNGEIYANIWPTYRIARIFPGTGEVVGWINLDGIMSPDDYKQIGWSSIGYLQGNMSVPLIEEACPNGIAYDAMGNRLFVTGKLWPKLYQIQLIPA